MKSRRTLLTATLLAAAATPLSGLITTATAADAKVQLMFVQSSESLRADDKTLRLVNVSLKTRCIFIGGSPRSVHRRSGWYGGSDRRFLGRA